MYSSIWERAPIIAALAVIVTVAVAESAIAAPPIVETSSDRRLVLVSGQHIEDVLPEVNKAAADDYRFLAVTSVPREQGISGLGFLLERAPEGDVEGCEYAFAQHTDGKYLNRKVRELATRGFRIVPGGLLERWQDYWITSGTRSLVVMERCPQSPAAEYRLIQVRSRRRLIETMTEHCESGYRFVGPLSSPKGWLMIVWERSPSGEDSDDVPGCNKEFEYVQRMSLKALKKQLIEHGTEGYHLLAATQYGLGKGYRALLLERNTTNSRPPDYRFLEDVAEIHRKGTGLAGGFRIHPGSLIPFFLVLESDSAALRPEYQVISPVPELLDAVSEARAKDFHVLHFESGGILLERFTKPGKGDLGVPP